jgi:hypothetical protein
MKTKSFRDKFQNIYGEGLSGRTVKFDMMDIDTICQFLHNCDGEINDKNVITSDYYKTVVSILKKCVGYEQHKKMIEVTRQWFQPDNPKSENDLSGKYVGDISPHTV